MFACCTFSFSFCDLILHNLAHVVQEDRLGILKMTICFSTECLGSTGKRVGEGGIWSCKVTRVGVYNGWLWIWEGKAYAFCPESAVSLFHPFIFLLFFHLMDYSGFPLLWDVNLHFFTFLYERSNFPYQSIK